MFYSVKDTNFSQKEKRLHDGREVKAMEVEFRRSTAKAQRTASPSTTRGRATISTPGIRPQTPRKPRTGFGFA